MDVCPMRLRDELLYWRIPPSALATCCRYDDALGRMPLVDHPESGSNLERRNSEAEKVEGPSSHSHDEVWAVTRVRQKLWLFLERPNSSSPAKVWSATSATFVLLSLAGLIISSMPEFQVDDEMTPKWYIQLLETW